MTDNLGALVCILIATLLFLVLGLLGGMVLYGRHGDREDDL